MLAMKGLHSHTGEYSQAPAGERLTICNLPRRFRSPGQTQAVRATQGATRHPPVPPPPPPPAAAAAAGPLMQERAQVPSSLREVDNGKILGFGADLAEDHPGFGDSAYKRRRMDIAALACTHHVGEPVPALEYLPEEIATWGTVLRETSQLYPTHACHEYLQTFPLFGFVEDAVPQLEAMSSILRQHTGWQIRPVAGLLHPRDFLNGLAFKTFHSTQYVRHHSRPMYTPEPDICHEILGHVPMLADPRFCEMVHRIGLASLHADEKQIWHLTKIYWHTVEFGLIREHGEIRAFGAGVLSSFGELENMRAGTVKLLEFDPFAPLPKIDYKSGYQKHYCLLDSFEDAAAKLGAFCEKLRHESR